MTKSASGSVVSAVPPAARRRMALLLLPITGVLAIAGLAPLAGAAGTGWSLVGAAVLAIAVVLGLIAVGLQRSARLDETSIAEAALDAELIATAACGADCGTEACGVADCAVRSLPRSQPGSTPDRVSP